MKKEWKEFMETLNTKEEIIDFLVFNSSQSPTSEYANMISKLISVLITGMSITSG